MENKTILYTVTPSDPAGHRLSVQLHIPHPDPQGQALFLPAWIPGSYLIRDFSRQVESIQASSGKHSVAVNKTGNHTWQCAPCTGPLTLDYTVYAWDLSVRSAHVDETHAFFNGTSVFLGVQDQTQDACMLLLNPPPHTADWKVYTSLPEANLHPQAAARHGFGMYQAPDYDALIDHPVEMGTPQVISFQAGGALHEMVFTGVAPNLDLERIAADTQKICAAQIEFFEPDTQLPPFLDSSDRYVFMTMITGDGYGGLEHRSSTALMASRGDLPVKSPAATDTSADTGYQSFLGLVSHEYFHTWNVKRIKPAVFAPYDTLRENHSRLLWVFEGFTSYYDDLMLLRSGVVTQPDYLRLLGKTISNVQRSPGRLKQSVAESSFDTWTRFYKQDENSPNALVSYYTKGALVALGLDLTLRHASKGKYSLDDVMRLMWQRYGRDFYQGQPQGIPEDAMASLIQEACGIDVSDFITRYAYGTQELPLQQLLADADIALTWAPESTLPSLDARWRVVNGETQLTTVYSGGAAHQAGLSAHDVLVAINGLRVGSTNTVERLLRPSQSGDTITIHVFRRDELRCFTLKLSVPVATEATLSRIAPV
ncbi:MAG: M61 family metallopeptidase [Burkholderiaceae bacterium]|nr:M61 family metallopeptidase [Burkholderiaceae bacterium]